MPRVLFGLGALLIVLGAIAWLLERAGIRLGHLPGDIAWGNGNVRVYVPIVTCILLSVVLSLVMWVVGAMRR